MIKLTHQLVQKCQQNSQRVHSKKELANWQTSQPTNHYFTGKQLDDTTGLYYYGARYYDPELGRFITADTVVQAPYDPQSLNRYSYVRNNPINYIDPSGHGWFKKFFGQIFGAIAGAAAFVFQVLIQWWVYLCILLYLAL